jgi:adenylate kinase family enzyme
VSVCSVRHWQLIQEKKRERRREQEEQLAVDMQKWQSNQERQHAREEAALRYELSQAERERQRQWERRTLVQMEADGCVNEFERNAQRLGLPIPLLAKKSGMDGDDDEDEGGGGSLALTAAEKRQLEATGGMDALQHLQFLGTKLPDPKTQSRNAHLHMAAIKAKTEADELARTERERRRRKVLVDQQSAAVEAETKRKQQRLLDMLQRQSAAERAMAESQWRTQQYKLIMRENRVFREQQMKQRFEQDAQIAVARDRQAWAAQQSEADQRRVVATRRYQEREAERLAAQRARHTTYCKGLLDSIVDLSMKAVSMRELGDELVPAAVWRDWMAAWVKQAPGVLPPPPAEDGADVANDGAIAQNLDEKDVKTLVHLIAGSSEEAAELMDLGQLDDYLNNLGAWRYTPSQASTQAMAAIVAAVTVSGGPPASARDKAPSAQPSARPAPSFEEAANQAAADAERAPHHLAMSVVSPLPGHRVEVEVPPSHTLGALVELIQNSALGPQLPSVAQVPSFPLGIILLGKPFAGKSTLVSRIIRRYAVQPLRIDTLVAEAAAEQETEAETASENESVGSRVRATLAEGGAISDDLYVSLVQRAITRTKENTRVGGWILVDFPLNLAQAQLLEAVLSGFELPAVKKSKDPKVKASKLAAPPPLPTRTDPIASGIDCVLRIDAPHELLLKRALGRRFDPVTCVHYHMDSNPPPDDEPIKARLVSPPGSEGIEAKLPDQFSAYDTEWPALSEWFGQFNLVRELDPLATEHAIYQQAIDLIDSLLVAKKQRAVELAASSKADTTADAAAPVPAVEGEAVAAPTPRTVAAIPEKAPIIVENEDSAISYLRSEGLMEQEGSKLLSMRWEALEEEFCQNMRRTFSSLRSVRVQQSAYITRTSRDFLKWLARPSEAKTQQLVEFQAEFNKIDPDLRLDEDLKAELHARSDDLSDRLWQLTLTRKQEAEAQLATLRADRFADWQAELLVQHYTQLVQLELDRHVQTLQVARDALYLRGHLTAPAETATGEALVASIPGLVRGVLPTVPAEFKTSARYQEWIGSGTGATLAAAASAQAAAVAAAPAAAAATAAKKGITLPVAAPAVVTAGNEQIALIYASVQEVIEFAIASALASQSDDVKPEFKASAAAAPAKESPQEKAAREAREKADQEAFEAAWVERQSSPASRVLQVLRREQIALFQRRLQRLRARVEADCATVRRRCEAMFARLDRALSLRVEGENNAIEALVSVVKTAIEREVGLQHALQLEGEDLLVERNLILFEEPALPDSSPLLPQNHASLFSPSQLLQLAHQVSASTSRLPVPDFLALFARLANATTGSAAAQFALPRAWQGRDRDFFHQLANSFSVPPLVDGTENSDVDWRQAIISMLLPVCGAPSLQELLASVRSAQAAVSRDASHSTDAIHQLIVPAAEFASVSLWSDRVDALKPFGPDSARDIRTALQHVFSRSAGDGIAVRELLLNLCYDDEYRSGLEKAFHICAATLEPSVEPANDPRIPVSQLGVAMFRGASTMDSVQKYVISSIAVAAPAEATVSYNELVDSEWNALVSQHYAYRRKDVTRILQ